MKTKFHKYPPQLHHPSDNVKALYDYLYSLVDELNIEQFAVETPAATVPETETVIIESDVDHNNFLNTSDVHILDKDQLKDIREAKYLIGHCAQVLGATNPIPFTYGGIILSRVYMTEAMNESIANEIDGAISVEAFAGENSDYKLRVTIAECADNKHRMYLQGITPHNTSLTTLYAITAIK